MTFQENTELTGSYLLMTLEVIHKVDTVGKPPKQHHRDAGKLNGVWERIPSHLAKE